jgi:signal transduction histidine kinase
VSNALKFSPVDSPVEVAVRRIGDEVVIAVADCGPGIPADELPRLFDRFSRLARTSDIPGTGIGLFIARSLAEAQGGRLEVASVEGEGATFSLVLPAASAASA